jgi:hypothetical protein
VQPGLLSNCKERDGILSAPLLPPRIFMVGMRSPLPMRRAEPVPRKETQLPSCPSSCQNSRVSPALCAEQLIEQLSAHGFSRLRVGALFFPGQFAK